MKTKKLENSVKYLKNRYLMGAKFPSLREHNLCQSNFFVFNLSPYKWKTADKITDTLCNDSY